MNALPGFSRNLCRNGVFAVAIVVLLHMTVPPTVAADAPVQNELGWNGEAIVALSGDWNFYWNILAASPEDIPDGAEAYTIPFFGSWHSNTEGADQLPWQGYGTYQKRIVLPPDTGSRVILRIPQLDTALRIFSNGVEVYSNGTVGRSAETSSPVEYAPVLRELSSETGVYDIFIQASNFDLRSFDYYLLPVIASVATAFRMQSIAFLSNALIVAALLILSLYLLLTGLRMENYRWCVYLGLAYIANVLYLLVNGEVFLGQIGLSRLFIWKFHYLARFLTAFFFFGFATEFFQIRIPAGINRGKDILGVLLSAVFLLADPPLLQRFYLLSQVIAYGVMVYAFVVAFKGIHENRRYAKVFMLSVIVVAVSMSFDLTGSSASWPILFNESTSIGLVLFGLIYTFLLTDIMKNHVTAIESLVNKRTEALEVSLWAQARYARVGEMLNFIAHQWQQYLYAISINIDGLQQEGNSELPAEKRSEIYGTISEAVQSMFSTLKDFRNFLSPVKDRERFDAGEECKKVFSLMEDLFRTENIHVSIEITGDTRVWGIKNELQQVVLNLLTNAVNIIRKRSIVSPEIRLRLIGESDLVSIFVEDNGGGVREGLQEELFEREKTEKPDGTGIGLYMSRRIVRERFQGELFWKEHPEGATFIIELPRDSRKTGRAPRTSPSAASLTG